MNGSSIFSNKMTNVPLDQLNERNEALNSVEDTFTDSLVTENTDNSNSNLNTTLDQDKLFNDALLSISNFEANKVNRDEAPSLNTSINVKDQIEKSNLELSESISAVQNSETIESLLATEDNTCEDIYNVNLRESQKFHDDDDDSEDNEKLQDNQNLPETEHQGKNFVQNTNDSVETLHENCNENTNIDSVIGEGENVKKLLSEQNLPNQTQLEMGTCISSMGNQEPIPSSDIFQEALEQLGYEETTLTETGNGTNGCIDKEMVEVDSSSNTEINLHYTEDGENDKINSFSTMLNNNLKYTLTDNSHNLDSVESTNVSEVINTNKIECNDKIDFQEPVKPINKEHVTKEFNYDDDDKCVPFGLQANQEEKMKDESKAIKEASVNIPQTDIKKEIGSASLTDDTSAIIKEGSEADTKVKRETEPKCTITQKEMQHNSEEFETDKGHQTKESTNDSKGIYLVDATPCDNETNTPKKVCSPHSKFGLKQCKVNLGNSRISDSMVKSKSDPLANKPNFSRLKRKLEDMLQSAHNEEENAMKQLKKMREEKSTMLDDILKEIQVIKKKFKV